MSEENCSICLEILNDNIFTLPECNHTFHNNCIIEWYRRLGSDCGCPLCRSSPDSSSRSYHSRRGRVKLYKQISRRKTCPIIIKRLCTKHVQCNKDSITLKKDVVEFRKTHKKLFEQYTNLRKKVWQNTNKKYKIEKELDSLPILLLLRQISI